MTSILDIPQVGPFKLPILQNDLHIGFAGDLARRIDRARWADEGRTSNVFPPLVDTLMASFLSAQLDEDEAYSVSQASLLTARRLEKDRRRDALYRAIRRTVATFASLSIFPDRQAAALLVLPVMERYAIDPDGGIEAQTVAVDQWLEEQLADEACRRAADELGIADSLQQLKSLNDEIQQLTAGRNDERAQRTPAALRRARRATDQAYRQLVLMLNSQAVVTSGDAASPSGDAAPSLHQRYVDLVRSIQETIRYYRQISDERRRQNRRPAPRTVG